MCSIGESAREIQIFAQPRRRREHQSGALSKCSAGASGAAPEKNQSGLAEIARKRHVSQDCARDAANYVHPKPANMQNGNDPDNPLNSVTDADRIAVMKAYLAENPDILKQVH